ncbi:MAG: Fic family protein [archaeon]|jgi:Fic family protein
MVYVFKKVVSGKSYYYLRASSRDGVKVISKDVAYLGSSVAEVKEALSKLPKFKKDIDKAYRKINFVLESNHFLEEVKKAKLKADDFLGNNLYVVEACALHFNKVFKKLDSLTKKEIFDNFVINFAFNTTSIEGNTIDLKEVRELLEEGLTPKGKTLREIYDLQNTKKVFEALDFSKEVSHELVKKIHASLLENIDARTEYRSRDVIVTKSRFKSTPFYLVKSDMDLLLKWYSENKTKLHPFVLAVIFHHKFEKIHPFMDGNGRTGRMLMNFILMKNDYPPAIIQKKNRPEFLDALGVADESFVTETKKEKYGELINFVVAELNEAYWNNFL